jgi:AcrR family transcriptional regulator
MVEEAGYAGLTTNEGAARAGVSIGSLYQYFGDKDALLAALAERHLVHECLLATDLDTPAEERVAAIVAVCAGYLDRARADPGCARPQRGGLAVTGRAEGRLR